MDYYFYPLLYYFDKTGIASTMPEQCRRKILGFHINFNFEIVFVTWLCFVGAHNSSFVWRYF